MFKEISVRYLTRDGIYGSRNFLDRIKIAARVSNGAVNFIGAHAMEASYVRVLPPAASSYLRLPFQFAYLHKVRRLVSEENPDLVEGHYLFPYGVLAAFSRHQNIALSLWGSDVFVDCVRDSYLRTLAKRAFENARFVHGECVLIRNVAIRLGCPEEKFFVIPWGVDLESFSPQNKSDQIRSEYGISSDAPVIISDRALEPLYRIDEIVKGFAVINKELPDAKLMILNDGTEKSRLLILCKELAISDSVFFIGTVSHERLPLYLNASDVYVQMPISDSLSISLLEAMACGLPVVISRAGGNPEAVVGNGFIVNDYSELAEKVLFMFRNNNCKDLGMRSREIAEKKFDRDANVAKMETLYRRHVS
jgi:glycosyltransferase involved in cell wall biosynthesis